MKTENEDVKFERCSCGATLIPIWNDWWDGDKHIKGIDLNVYKTTQHHLTMILFWKLVNQDTV